MITDREILRFANEMYTEFLTDFLVDCHFEAVSLTKFFSIADKSVFVQDLIKDGIYKNVKEINIPILVVPGDKFRLIFCGTIINKILRGFSKEKQKMFIYALTLHELYHIMNQSKKRDINQYNFIRSEKLALQEFKEDYPELTKTLEEAKKRFKKK
jgi:hypothetical protein